MMYRSLIYDQKKNFNLLYNHAQLEYKTHLIEGLEQRANNIIQEREQNKMDCEILGEDVPYDLLWLCGEPK